MNPWLWELREEAAEKRSGLSPPLDPETLRAETPAAR